MKNESQTHAGYLRIVEFIRCFSDVRSQESKVVCSYYELILHSTTETSELSCFFIYGTRFYVTVMGLSCSKTNVHVKKWGLKLTVLFLFDYP